MKIIALQGVANSGKTTTIKLLDQKLIKEGYTPIAGKRIGGAGDFSDVYRSPKGKIIGITSTGDTHDMVRSNLERLIKENCEIIICACRSYDRMPPGTVAAVQGFPSHPVTFIQKTRTNDSKKYGAVNQADANTLYQTL